MSPLAHRAMSVMEADFPGQSGPPPAKPGSSAGTGKQTHKRRRPAAPAQARLRARPRPRRAAQPLSQRTCDRFGIVPACMGDADRSKGCSSAPNTLHLAPNIAFALATPRRPHLPTHAPPTNTRDCHPPTRFSRLPTRSPWLPTRPPGLPTRPPALPTRSPWLPTRSLRLPTQHFR